MILVSLRTMRRGISIKISIRKNCGRSDGGNSAVFVLEMNSEIITSHKTRREKARQNVHYNEKAKIEIAFSVNRLKKKGKSDIIR